MYKNTLYLTLKLIALAAVFAYDLTADTVSGFNVAAVLAFCCLFMTDFLVGKFCRGKVQKILCYAVIIAGCFVCGAEAYFPLFIVTIFELIDLFETEEYFYWIAVSSALLAAFIFTPVPSSAVTALIVSAVGGFLRITLEKLEYFRKLSEEQRKSISVKSEKISELKAYSKTLREAAALEERNRFSVRIHDKLGHGISGSIILLEGAKLNLQTNPEQAEKCLETAIESLRGSVDSIREALHEERPKRNVAGIAEFKEMLEKFSVTYGIKTDFSIEGNTEKITPQVWNCLKKNLTEALTNTVKHSKASSFAFRIVVYNKIIRAEFSDNGRNHDGFSKGIGLSAIEERTAECGGKILFQCGNGGFKIINIFGM